MAVPESAASRSFIAIDVETANADPASICQIGLARFAHGQLSGTFQSLVNPGQPFDWRTVRIHGIGPDDVASAPDLGALVPELRAFTHGSVLASHTLFDRSALQRALTRYGASPLENAWIDTAVVVRRTWPEYRMRGYGLANIAGVLGLEFRHHDALEDARAAGEVLSRAMVLTGTGVEDWLAPPPGQRRARPGPVGQTSLRRQRGQPKRP